MGNKRRNKDGSKKKNVQRIKNEDNLKNVNGLEHCNYCGSDIPINEKCLREHYESKSHIRNLTISTLLPSLKIYGIDWLVDTNQLHCTECNKNIESKPKSLLRHVEDYHGKISKYVSNSGEEDFSDNSLGIRLMRCKFVAVDFPNAEMNVKFCSFRRLATPFLLHEDSPGHSFMADVRNDVFSNSDLTLISKAAKFLETGARNIKRSDNIEGTKMHMFGMRWARGDTGWYKHTKSDCYKVSEELANFVSIRLEKRYPCVYEHLRNIVKAEGFEGGESSIGGTPFTSFAFTRDYNCKPHRDPDDYDLGFVLWIKDENVADEEEASVFALPELKVAFTPKNGDVLCIKACDLVHCTRSLRKTNQLGIAFIQKASLFRHLKKLLNLPMGGKVVETVDEKGKKLAVPITERRVDFERKKISYEKQCLEGK